MFDKYPYTDFHELNTDWIVGKIKDIDDSVIAAKASEDAAAQSASDAHDSELAAAQSASDAHDSELAAAGSASDAHDSELAAAQSAIDAANTVSSTNAQIALLQSRVDNIIPDGTQTEGNTELLDIRVGFDSVTYSSAGDAVRGQIDAMFNAVNSLLNVDVSVVDVSTNKADGYFKWTGEIRPGTSGGAFYTPTALTLHEGDVVFVNASGYLTNMAIIVSGSYGDGDPLAVCSPGQNLYYYRADRTIDVRFCCLIAYENEFFIKLAKSQIVTDLTEDLNISTFKKYGVVGDSLSSGECVHNDSGSNVYTDFYHFSWIQFLARKTGNPAINFSKGGLTTRSWLSNSEYGLAKLLDPDNKCDCYVIALGVNDVNSLGSGYLGTSEDIDISDPTQSEDTFYGNYAKIIGYIRQMQPKAIIFCLTMPNPTEDSTVDDFNNAIGDITSILSTNLITLTTDDFNKTRINRRWGHYNAWGYNQWCDIIAKHINEYMIKYPDKFKQIEFIGTNYSWT